MMSKFVFSDFIHHSTRQQKYGIAFSNAVVNFEIAVICIALSSIEPEEKYVIVFESTPQKNKTFVFDIL